MKTQSSLAVKAKDETALYGKILVALDSSDHANQGMGESIALAQLTEGADITGVHAYAAQLHDVRFRQMEGGLPEQFREEQELERQRDVHDDLISRGLSIITDSYLDQAERDCQRNNIEFSRRSIEGKNYRQLTEETNTGQYDLLVMGALGLGAVEGSRLGTVCQRVARRASIDTLVIKEPGRSIKAGPIVVAIDGSTRSYGSLITALQLAQHWGITVQAIAVFDPYFHYVAFNRIADVLSEEAGKIFKFKEQERLHEEIIDSGLAKIYQGHLDVSTSIAEEHGVDLETILLDGKPHDAITKYIRKVNASLLILGKLGIHADDELDIGGNAENLLVDSHCAVLLSQRQYQPKIDVVAEASTSWTNEALQAMGNIPDFVQNMAKMAILRYAQKQGHTVITASIVKEATATLCPSHAREAMAEIVAAKDAGELNASEPTGFKALSWSTQAKDILNNIDDPAIRDHLRIRAEKKARTENSTQVEKTHLESFITPSALDTNDKATDPNPSLAPRSSLHWPAVALARLMRVPEGFMRDNCKQQAEDDARQQNLTDITLAITETGIQQARKQMEQGIKTKYSGTSTSGGCPFGKKDADATDSQKETTDTLPPLVWERSARKRVQKIPEGFMRNLSQQRIENFARKKGVKNITLELIEEKYNAWGAGSAQQSMQLKWDDTAMERVTRIPDFVRGMIIKEVERCASDQGADKVTVKILDAAINHWQDRGIFHSDMDSGSYKK